MAGGILAHLGHRMTKQQEVLATEGLAYLLQNSDACSGALRHLAQQAGCTLPVSLVYRPEVSGDDLERPDVVGFDDQSREVAILEGKFYAGLTDNQPNAYLPRLSKVREGLLLFVVPDLRVPRLWEEVTSRAQRHTELGPFHELAGNTRYTQSSNGVTLMMTSWRELLDTMMVASKAAAEPITADIFQLQVLCERIEGEAFLPFASEELTGLMQPIRHRDLCNLVDAIVDETRRAGHVSLEGLNATPKKEGYIRYVWLGGNKGRFGAFIGLRYDLWVSSGDGPLWFGVQNMDAIRLRSVYQRVGVKKGLNFIQQGNQSFLNLPLAASLEFDELVELAADITRDVVYEIRQLAPEN